jgi:putative ATP-dependent endonuclease of the OLD family
MYIKQIVIDNFKCFEGTFVLDLNPHLNILVGDNESGKSTILEAIHLALSGWIFGRPIQNELTQSLFNDQIVRQYLASLMTNDKLPPPKLFIELYLEIEDESLSALFHGNGNSKGVDACGIKFCIEFNEKYKEEYNSFLSLNDDFESMPIEYYDYYWNSFARNDRITPRTIPIRSAFIDSSNSKTQNGSDLYISRIIRDLLTDEEKVKISQAHRKLKDSFVKSEAIVQVNREILQKQITEKRVELSVDLSTKNAWETSISTSLDDIPFQFIGRGEQSLVKTKLALSHKKAKEANILLLEEPENHLSHTKLNRLLKYIKDSQPEKQIILSTHSSFVANKLGLGNLTLLNCDSNTKRRKVARINELNEDTKTFFEKLSGYDTLRMVLCKKAILVEGPSDELIVQKAYLVKYGKLPIEDETDVISVGTSFLRFLEIAEKIQKLVVVVTDNDGHYDTKVTNKYIEYANDKNIYICCDKRENLNTLEPQLVDANQNQLELIREVLGIQGDKFTTPEQISSYMQDNKTECALKIFLTDRNILFPTYINDSINWKYEHE